MSTIQITNSKTGFVASASQKDWDSGVYDKSVWSAATAPTPVSPTATAGSLGATQIAQIQQQAAKPAQPANVLNTADLSKPTATPQVMATPAGQHIKSPEELKTLTAADIAKTSTGDIYRRDLAREQAAMADFTARYGKPATSSDWTKFHDFVYGKGATGSQDFTTSQAVQTAPLSGEVIPAEQPKTIIEQKQDLIANYFADTMAKKAELGEQYGVGKAQQEMSVAQKRANESLEIVEKAQADLELKGILNAEAQVALKKAIENRGGGMALINGMLNREMSDMDQEQRLSRALDIYQLNANINKHNADLRAVALAQGNYQMARQNVQEDMEVWGEVQRMTMDLLTEMGQLEKEERARMDAEINYERGLMMDGYVHIEDTDTYNQMVKKFGVTAENFSQFFYKDPGTGKIYMKPDTSKDVVSTINANGKLYGINSKGDIVKEYGSTGNFQFKENSDGSYSVFDPSSGDLVIKTSPEKADFDFGNGTITAYGSPAWAHGLDFVLDGGKGAPVPAMIGGEIIFAGKNGGFGNQVKIRTEQGEELWISHLDNVNVKVGDRIEAGTILGAQGNTGTVMGMNGQSYSAAELAAGKGTHLDLTIKKADGGFYSAKEVAELLGHKNQKNEFQNYLVEALGLPKDKMDRLSQLGLDEIQISNVAGIMSGLRPPLTTSEMRTVGGQKTAAGLSAMGYDLSKANQDWTSMQKRLSSMNSTQQLRLSQAIMALEGSTSQAERLYADWQKTGLPGGFSSYNKAALSAAANLPGEAGVAARTLVSHIEDMAAELAVIYRGGNTPTDMALEAARKSLDANWNNEQFAKNLALIRENVQIRKNSIANSSYIEGNIYNQSSALSQVDNATFFGSLNMDYSGLSFDDLINSMK